MRKASAIIGNFVVISLLFSACEPAPGPENQSAISAVPVENRLPDTEAGTIVQNSLEWAGGLENWVEKKTLVYTKITMYYDSTGTLERSAEQLHQYQLHPQFKARISWQDGDDQYVIINNGMQAWKFRNDQPLADKSDVDQAWNSSFGSHYVMCMPFKLNDPGVVLEYEGLDSLPTGEVAHSVKTTYLEGAGSSAGMHTWWYYFDPDTYRPVANFLDYGDGYTYTYYAKFQEVDGIQLNQERHSYPADAESNLQYRRTVYQNENVRFDVELESGLFEPIE